MRVLMLRKNADEMNDALAMNSESQKEKSIGASTMN